MSRIPHLVPVVLWMMGTSLLASEEDLGQPTGHFLSPIGTVPGLTTVEVEVQDSDGLERVWVTFVESGDPLVLCGFGAPADCPGSAGLLSREEVDPLDFGAALGPVTAALWVRDLDGIEEVAAEVTFLLEEDPIPRYVLTVRKQGEGVGFLESMPAGIDCGLSCTEQSFEFIGGTEVQIVASGLDFTGFAGDRCFGTDPCQLTIDRSLELFAVYEPRNQFRLLGTRPTPNTTDFPTEMTFLLIFDREVQPGVTWSAISLTTTEGEIIPIEPSILSLSRERVAIGTPGLRENQSYFLEIPAGAVADLAGNQWLEGQVIAFSTAPEENRRIHLAAFPELLAEGEEVILDLWLDRPSSIDRTVLLATDPPGSLSSLPSSITLPAGEIHFSLTTSAGPTDFDKAVALRATESYLGSTSQVIQIDDVDPLSESPVHLDQWLLIDDENENGTIEAGEKFEYHLILCNEGEVDVPHFEVCLSVLDVPSFADLAPNLPCRLIGFLNPGQCRLQNFRFRSLESLPEGEYWLRITGESVPFLEHTRIPVINEALVNYELTRKSRNFTVLEPRETVFQPYVAHNRGDDTDPRLPELRFEVKNTNGQVVQEHQGFIDARRETDLLYFLAFEAPEESGEYHVNAEINPPPDAVPETTTEDNHAEPFSFVVNRATTLDPLGGPYRVAMGESFTLGVSAQDPEGDSLEFRTPWAPSGMDIQNTGPQSARIQWTPPEAEEPYNREIQVEVRDGFGRSQSNSFLLNVDRKTDLEIRVSVAPQRYVPGIPLIFEAAVRNRGPVSLAAASFSGSAEPPHLATSWTCTASPGSTCGGSGTQLQDLDLAIATGGVVTYRFTTHLPSGAQDMVSWDLCVRPDPPTADETTGNDCDIAAVSVAALDFGDAPDSTSDPAAAYPTQLEDDGARHGIDLLRLGPAIDSEDNGQPSPDARGDDRSGPDEDGLTISPALVGDVVVVEADATGPGLLSAWIDWNRDGDWLDEDEQALTDYPLDGEDLAEIMLPVPDAAVPGTTFGRFRLSTHSGLGIGGPAPDGEVEDHPVDIVTEAALSFAASAVPESPPEPGGPFEVFLEITNSGEAPLRIESLDASGQPVAGNCSTPLHLEPAAHYGCSVAAEIFGNAGDSSALDLTAFASTLGGSQQLVQQAQVDVLLDDVLPDVELQVTAQPEQLPAGGGLVTFSLGITNTSPAEALTLDTLFSDPLGDLDGLGTCNVPRLLPLGGTYVCAFTSQLQGSPGDSIEVETTARVTDDEGNSAQDSAPSTIDIEPAHADLAVELSDRRIYAAPGRPITYWARVRNLGPEAAAQATVEALLPVELLGCQWTCEAALGTCTAAGSRDLQDTVTLEPNGWALYTIRCEVDSNAQASGFLIPTAEVEPAPTTLDPAPENNSATDVTELAPLIFADGFESGDTSGWAEP